MSITVVCPSCQSKVRAASHLTGGRVKCPKCGVAIRLSPTPAPDYADDPQRDAHSVADSEIPEAAPRRTAGGAGRRPAWQNAVLIASGCMKGAIWFVCLLWTLFVIFAYATGGSKGESAIQEAARAGDACAFLIAGYVVARAADYMVRLIEGGASRLLRSLPGPVGTASEGIG